VLRCFGVVVGVLTINLLNYENVIVLRCVLVVVLTISDIVPKHVCVIRS